MTNGDRERLAARAVLALAMICFLLIVAGVVLALLGQEIPGIAAMVTGACGGIVAIVLRENPP